MNANERSPEQLQRHYELEIKLAKKLMEAGVGERPDLYGVLYDELFSTILDHPQLVLKEDAKATAERVSSQMRLLLPLIKPDSVFVEVGAGDCALSFEMAKNTAQVIAVDVSDLITASDEMPNNAQLRLTSGTNIPVEDNSASLVYSNQLMEHLHPDDALEQLRNIHSCLAQGGRYLCITPSSLTGPHDISMYFDDVAKGFHLKEYTVRELRDLFSSAGFDHIQIILVIKGISLRVPSLVVICLESVLELLPQKLRKTVSNIKLIRSLLVPRVLATKK